MRNGVVVSVASFAQRMIELGHRVTIFTAHHPDQRGPEEGVYRFPSINFPSRARYPVAIPWAIGKARRALVQGHFDVVHANAPMLMGHAALWYARRRGLPLVFTYHTLYEEYVHYVPFPRLITRPAARWVSRYYSNEVDRVITPTEHVAARLRDYGVVKPITVLPTGIDLGVIDAGASADVRARYAIPPRAPLLVYVGRLAKEKNITRLLGAFRRVLAAQPDAHLLLIGGGPFTRGLHALAREMGLIDNFHVTGFLERDDVMQALYAADLFVFASLTETQGLAIGEAMACSVPIVTVTSPAAREMVTDGREGLLVDDDDATFADAVLHLIRTPVLRREMAIHARRRAEHLSVAACTDRLLDLYYTAIEARQVGEGQSA